MFQYALGRSLANRFGYALEALPIAGLPHTQPVLGERVLGPQIIWEGQWPYDTERAELIGTEELHVAPDAHLVLHGSFQRFELYSEDRESIRCDWLRLAESAPLRPASDFVICLLPGEDPTDGRARIAGGIDHAGETDSDSTDIESLLSECRVRRLARTVAHKRLYVVTDKPNHARIRALRDLSPIIVTEGLWKDFTFINSFQKIAFSQCAFHWWAAFLSCAKEIYYPPCSNGLWSHPGRPVLAHEAPHHGIDLRVDENRYIYDW